VEPPKVEEQPPGHFHSLAFFIVVFYLLIFGETSHWECTILRRLSAFLQYLIIVLSKSPPKRAGRRFERRTYHTVKKAGTETAYIILYIAHCGKPNTVRSAYNSR
jgi:hypothetical protein